MTNINCSANCIHEDNGQCALSHVGTTSKELENGTDCAYFSLRDIKVLDTPPEKK